MHIHETQTHIHTTHIWLQLNIYKHTPTLPIYRFQKISNQYLKPCLLKKGHSGPGESLMKVSEP